MKETIEAKKSDAVRLEMGKLRADEERQRTRSRVQEMRRLNEEFTRRRRRDVTLAVEFSKRQLSVSKALLRHEFLTLKEERVKRNFELVESLVEMKRRQNVIIRDYLTQRNKLRQEEAANERELIEQRLKAEEAVEQYEAKRRVEFLMCEKQIRRSFSNELDIFKNSYYRFVRPDSLQSDFYDDF